MNVSNDFKKFANSRGINSMTLHNIQSVQNSYISPTIIEERQMNVASMDVFSRLMMERIIFLGTGIDDHVANVIQAQLLYLQNSGEEDITMYVNSGGGSVYAGYGIYDTMQYITPDVRTICTGMAASMAAILLTAGTAGKRSALPHSRVMIHQPLGGSSGQATDIEIAAKEIGKVKKELYDIIVKHTGQKYDKVYNDSERDFWMIAEEARKYGLIDNVITKPKK